MMRKERKQVYSYLFITVLLMSCADEQKIELTKFDITVPKRWQVSVFEKDDGYRGVIYVPNDSVFFNFGELVGQLAEQEPNVLYVPLPRDTVNKHFDTSKFILADRRFFDIDRYRKQNVSFFAKENGLRFKITYPRVSGKGMTGVYVDSLYRIGKHEVMQFNLYVNNFPKEHEGELIKAIKTISFKNPL